MIIKTPNNKLTRLRPHSDEPTDFWSAIKFVCRVTVGRVAGAKLSPDFNAVLSLEINEGVKIPDDSSASIVSSGLMGNKYIEIEAGGSEDYISAGGEFEYTQDAMVLEELLDRIVTMGKAKQNKSEQAVLTQFEENAEDE